MRTQGGARLPKAPRGNASLRSEDLPTPRVSLPRPVKMLGQAGSGGGKRAVCLRWTVCCGVLMVAVIAGAIVGVQAFMDARQLARGASAPESLQASSGDVMTKRAHGTCIAPVQSPLRWGCDVKTADRISCFNRHWAERAGYWEQTSFLSQEATGPVTFYDSVTSQPLFRAPVGRSWQDFIDESVHHGWPSFRDAEVLPERVRVLEDGETVSVDGTHLGHNLPDSDGNRYCINLVSVAGFAPGTAEGKAQIAAIDAARQRDGLGPLSEEP